MMDRQEPQTCLSFDRPEPPVSSEPASPGVRLVVDEQNLGWVLFDTPGKRVNTFNLVVLETLRSLLDQAVRKEIKGLVFASDKPDMFVAGMDVPEIERITDPQLGMEKAAYGQAIFETIARMPFPTATVINGPCLGGGYELALASDYRIAEDSAAVKIGLPEIKLGIFPGFGGTQRLPHRVGIRVALDLILAGKVLAPRPAFRRGMVDVLVPPGSGRRVAGEILLGTWPVTPASPPRIDKWIGAIPFLRRFVFIRAEKILEKKIRRNHYPAPFDALKSIAVSFSRDEVYAYRNEAKLVGDLIVSDTAKSLMWLFKTTGQAKEPQSLNLDQAKPVNRLGVLGAGVMGGEIAWLASEKKLPVRIKDISPQALEGAVKTAGSLWARRVKQRRLKPSERDRRLEQLSFTLDYSGFQTVDLAIEAVVENLDVKQTVVTEAEAVLSPRAVLASNTSSLQIGDIASRAQHPERIVGMHFFNPVHRMPLVEVIAGPRSASWAVATAYQLALDLGKTPILVKDGPGFLVNRLLSFYLGEALHLLERGLDPTHTDRILVRFGMPMGPFALLDQIGLDVGEKVTHVIADAFGDRLPGNATLGRLTAEGHFGKKTGRGFYVYRKGKNEGPASEAARAAGNSGRWDPPDAEVLDRVLLPMINEAARCLDEKVVTRPLDVDLGMVMGTGFPPFRGGLLRYADRRGVGEIIQRLEILAHPGTPRLAPSEALKKRISGFYPT